MGKWDLELLRLYYWELQFSRLPFLSLCRDTFFSFLTVHEAKRQTFFFVLKRKYQDGPTKNQDT